MSRTLALLLLGLWIAACSDAATTSEDNEVGSRDVGNIIPPPRADTGVPDPDASNQPLPDQGVVPDNSRELQLQTNRDQFMLFESTTELTVKYVEFVPGQATPTVMANRPVQFKILDLNGTDRTVEGVGNTQLVSTRSTANAQGLASVTLRAGARPDGPDEYSFRVEASAEGAPSVYWNVTVADIQEGDLRVVVRYDFENLRYRQSDLQTVQVYIFDHVNCATARQMLPNEVIGSYAQFPPIENYDAFTQETSFPALEVGVNFSLLATGENIDGHVTTWGCVDNVQITGRENTVEIDMDDLPLVFKGQMKALHKFNLFGLLETSGNPALETAAQLLDLLRVLGSDNGDRGRALVEIVCELASIGEGTCDILQSIGGPLIDRAIEEWVPQNVTDIFGIISDVLSIVAEMTVIGELEFTETSPDETGSLGDNNDSRWQKFRFDWRDGCPPGDSCRREIPVGSAGDSQVDNRRVVAGVFSARVEGVNLFVEPHGMSFKYGIIALGVIEQWLLPAIFDEEPPEDGNGLAWILSHVLPCEDINEALGLARNDPLCYDVLIMGISEVLYGQLARLDFAPDQFQISGVCEIKDTNGDLTVDVLEHGEWDGVINLGNSSLNFKGCFEGCRGADCTPRECVVPAVE
ncbi:hypothetical protein KJ940_04505 [Myxococcota bacterium]|nr:hypothetical protein [Myxococcota bacterium]